MIKGYFHPNGLPLIDCTISIPDLSVAHQPITMLISTGTPQSFIHPNDVRRMTIPRSQAPPYQEQTFNAVLTFRDQEGLDHPFEIPALTLIYPNAPFTHTTSVMGMDVLQQTSLHYSAKDSFLSIETHRLHGDRQ